MSDNVKRIAGIGGAVALAIAMGLQTFVFGQNDLQTMKEEIGKLTERVSKLEAAR